MSSCILLSHVFVRANEQYKHDIISFVVSHYIKNNPNVDIILCGHGLVPPKHITNNLKSLIWETEIRESEIGHGHPHFVNLGLVEAKKLGHHKVLKMRADGILLFADSLKYCEDIVVKEKTSLLITQMTSIRDGFMGDLFMYGDVDFLIQLWDNDTWWPTSTGLISLKRNFSKTVQCDDYATSLKRFVSIRDIFSLKWIDVADHWADLSKKQNELYNNVLVNFPAYLWGALPNWVNFNDNGYCSQHNAFVCESNYYEKNTNST